jgi:ribosome-associated toxin RatA of RatAB toxin-antitoxin module
MTTKVEKRIMVNVPVSTAYNQWTQFEDFPQFMGGVKSVTQLSDDRLEWVAEIAGVRRKWEARILEQVPDQKIAWAATEGATNAGVVTFEDVGGGQTSVYLSLEYEPEGLVEKVGDKLNIVENQAERDLERFKTFIESEGYATGAWRGSVNEGAQPGTPGVEAAAESRGDSGKSGVSGKAVAAGLGAAAAAAGAVAAGAAAKKSGDATDESTATEDTISVQRTPMESDTVTSTGVGYDSTATPTTAGMDYPAATGAGTSALSYDEAAGAAGTADESTSGVMTPEDEDRLGYRGTDPESRPMDR